MSVDSEFIHARERLLDRFNGDRLEAHRVLKSNGELFVAKATLDRLFDTDIRDDEFLGPVRKGVIEYISPSASSKMYFNLAKAIVAGSDEIKKIERYVGRYRYFRKNTSGQIVSGTIDIIRKDDFFVFFHSNDEKAGKFPMPKPDHQGYVFQLGSRLHLLGIGPRYLRPIIAHECPDLKKEPVHGFVIANTAQSRGGHLFAARFVMFHQRHPSYKAKQADRKIKQFLDESGVRPGILTLE